MRSVVLDELRPSEIERIREYLSKTIISSRLPEVFWLELPPDLLSPEQMAHKDTCGPFRAALVLEGGELRLELLVRGQASLHCTCTAFASKAQRDFLLSFLDRLVEELGIIT
jgi:hypothetical protein